MSITPSETAANDKQERLNRLVARVKGLPPIPVAVAYPCDKESLRGPLMAAAAGIIQPILVGPEAKIRALAEEFSLDLKGVRIVDVASSIDSANRAVQLVRENEAVALMKGSLHTDELMGAVVSRANEFRTKRRISHVFVMDVPTYPRPMLITDAAVNIAPTLEEKVDIAQNAIDLAHALGIAEPKVAILAAVETVNPKMPATLEAAALCKMADRGQIKGGILDGPLAFDNAVSPEAVRIKGIKSPVAGQADIFLVPNLEVGNVLFKQLEYLANALTAGIVLGAKAPVILTSRADSAETRTASCVIAALIAHANKKEK
ncbi:phosphate acetyl/butyryl transferase [Betaproteobacteria bacterium]|nr:phosphate acetyl/butyryl transferase [Betaproteobacteria bacterium]GHU40060.1 phosphate acetyl/butyryl transferase [Betaproteobacteria bacterium]